MEDSKTYFAAREAEEAATVILSKANDWFNSLDSNGYLNKVREMWAAYHGAYYTDLDDGHRIVFGGEQGELAQLAVNHIRNIAQHILVMITSTRPSMEARATNTDHKSQAQTILANGLLDYYMREKRLEDYIKRAAEYAIVLGSGFIKMEWNATSGELFDYIDEERDEVTGEITQEGYPIYQGDVEFSNLSPFDVVFDSTKEDQKHDWILTRSFKNRFDLKEKYPELAEKILALPTKDEADHYQYTSIGFVGTDDIPVYEFYHKKSESMPDGRYLLFLESDIILMDAPMPYDTLPVFRMAPSDILGTPYGYTPMFDLLPLQEAVNNAYSTILSNHNAFGVQNIIMPRGTDINPSSIVGGLNIIEYNAQMGKPEALNLTQTPKEVFEFLGMLERAMETVSGINSVARGNPESSLKSGTALALIQSNAVQYISGFQQSYVKLIEDIGTSLIKMLQKFASVPRIAMISGKKNRQLMKEFTGDDLNKINRVIVDVANPLSRTTAGRVQMAEQMLQMGIITTPEQYISVINTGEIDSLTEDTQHELLNVRAENERLVGGELPVVAVVTDQHSLHIKQHKSVLADPELRLDPDLVQRTLAHIQEHIQLLRESDPDLLMMMGEQPLGPMGGSPANQPAPGQMVNESQMPNQPPMPPQGGQPPQVDPAGMPELPRPAPPFENAPINPGELPPNG